MCKGTTTKNNQLIDQIIQQIQTQKKLWFKKIEPTKFKVIFSLARGGTKTYTVRNQCLNFISSFIQTNDSERLGITR